MHWSLWGVSHLGLAKLVNCNQIPGHVAVQDYIEFLISTAQQISSLSASNNISNDQSLAKYIQMYWYAQK